METAGLTDKEIIESQDFLHPYTTSKDHVLWLYELAMEVGARNICELGSYKGISTVALALAAKQNDGFVISVDLCDEIQTVDRVRYWTPLGLMRHIFPYRGSSMEFLQKYEGKLDFIFHDSHHGDAIIPELVTAWELLNPGGILAVHDYEQIVRSKWFEESFIADGLKKVMEDERGRYLAAFKKA